jgi:hypothetical protein
MYSHHSRACGRTSCCSIVPEALRQDIEHIAVLIDCRPQVVGLAVDREKHLIEVPLVAWLRSTATQLSGKRLPGLAAPLPHRLVRRHYSPLVQELLDITVAKRDAMLKSDGVREDLLLEPKPL